MISEKITTAAVSAGVTVKKIWLKHALERETLEKMSADHGASGDDRELRKAYRDFVLPYWKKYGRRPKYLWFRYFGSRDGIIRKRRQKICRLSARCLLRIRALKSRRKVVLTLLRQDFLNA